MNADHRISEKMAGVPAEGTILPTRGQSFVQSGSLHMLLLLLLCLCLIILDNYLGNPTAR